LKKNPPAKSSMAWGELHIRGKDKGASQITRGEKGMCCCLSAKNLRKAKQNCHHQCICKKTNKKGLESKKACSSRRQEQGKKQQNLKAVWLEKTTIREGIYQK